MNGFTADFVSTGNIGEGNYFITHLERSLIAIKTVFGIAF